MQKAARRQTAAGCFDFFSEPMRHGKTQSQAGSLSAPRTPKRSAKSRGAEAMPLFSGVYFCIFAGGQLQVSGVRSGVLSGILSGVLPGVLSGVLSAVPVGVSPPGSTEFSPARLHAFRSSMLPLTAYHLPGRKVFPLLLPVFHASEPNTYSVPFFAAGALKSNKHLPFAVI